MRTPVLVWEVTFRRSSAWRKFRSFEEAERYARKVVAASADEQFADSASIVGPGESAGVVLDGNGRVWTEYCEWPAA